MCSSFFGYPLHNLKIRKKIMSPEHILNNTALAVSSNTSDAASSNTSDAAQKLTAMKRQRYIDSYRNWKNCPTCLKVRRNSLVADNIIINWIHFIVILLTTLNK